MMTIEKLDELRETANLLLEVKRERERAAEAGEVPSLFQRDAARARYAVAKGAVESALAEWWAQGCKNPPMGATDDVVTLTKAEFDALLTYDTSLPTGTTVGKRWKRVIGDVWWMGEYVAHADPGVTGIRWSKIRVNMGHYTVRPRAPRPAPAVDPSPDGALNTLARSAAKLLRDVARLGLMQGGEQYPNALCCIDAAAVLENAAEAALHPREEKPGAWSMQDNPNYTVVAGDTLYGIAKKFGVTYGSANTYSEGAAFLARMNFIPNPDKIRPGLRILLPRDIAIDGALEAMWAETARSEAARADAAEATLAAVRAALTRGEG